MGIICKIKSWVLVLLCYLITLNVCAQSADSDKYFELGVQLYELENYHEAAQAFLKCYKQDLIELPENSVRRDYGRMWLIACTSHGDDDIRGKYLIDIEWSDKYYEYSPIDRRKTIESDAFAQIGLENYEKGNIVAAIQNYRRCAEIEEKQLGSTCWYYANTLLILAELYSLNAQYEEARDKYVNALDILERISKEELGISGYIDALSQTNHFCSKYNIYPELQNSTHKQYIDAVGDASYRCMWNGQYEKAEMYDSLSVKMAAESFGKHSLEYSNALHYRSMCYSFLWMTNENNKSECLSHEINCLWESITILLELDNNDYNDLLIERLVCLYGRLRELDSVEYKDTMNQLKKTTEDHICRQLPEEQFRLYVKYYGGFFLEDDWEGKLRFYTDMIKIAKDNDLANTLEYAELLNELSTLYFNKDWCKYEEYELQRLGILKQYMSYDEYIDKLKKIYHAVSIMSVPNGQFEYALKAYKKLSEISYAENGETLEYGCYLKRIGEVYVLMGKASEAIDILNQALDIYRRLEADEVDVIELANLIDHSMPSVGLNDLLEKRTKILEIEGHSDTYFDLTEKIYYEYKIGGFIDEAIAEVNRLIDYEKSNSYKTGLQRWELEKAYCLYESNPDETHDKLIDSLFVEYEKSLSELNVIANSEKYDAYVFYALHNYSNNDYKSAITWFTKAINLYPYIKDINLYQLLYTTYRYDDQVEEAEVHFKKFCDVVTKEIRHTIPYMNLSERWTYWKEREKNLMAMSRYAWRNPSDVTCAEAYNSLLLTKGFILMTEVTLKNYIEDLGEEDLLKLYGDVVTKKSELDYLKKFHNVDESTVMACERELHRLELSMMQNSALQGYSDIFMTNWKDIHSYLKDNEIAIEFVEREFYKNERTVLAFVIKKAYDAPRVIPMDGLIECYDSLSVNLADISLLYKNEILYDKVWGRLEPEMVGVDNVYFSPDGILSTFAIENLSRNGEMPLSSKKLYRLSSTREILNVREREVSKAALYGGLDFYMCDETYDKVVNTEKLDRRAVVEGLLGELDGTEAEVEQIKTILEDNRLKPDVYTGCTGTEESFKSLSGNDYSLIHVASHGSYLSAIEASIYDDQSENLAMARSCLYFAGANNALLQGNASLGDNNNGILTAKEIAMLDFKNVDLVVLSACETGLGDVTSEGVFGLQRGFKKAGVGSVLMSLWNVDDEATSRLMTEFYTNWTEKKMTKYDSLEAAKEVIRETERWESPNYWAAFVLLDGLQ